LHRVHHARDWTRNLAASSGSYGKKLTIFEEWLRENRTTKREQASTIIIFAEKESTLLSHGT